MIHAEHWNHRFLDLARYVGTEWSKDPDKQVGAVLVSPDRATITPGYNGLPRNVADDPELLADKAYKLPRTIHAELNAIFNAPQRPVGHVLYVWPIPPCLLCAGPIIQPGTAEVWSPPVPETSSWFTSCHEGREMLHEAGVATYWLDDIAGA